MPCRLWPNTWATSRHVCQARSTTATEFPSLWDQSVDSIAVEYGTIINALDEYVARSALRNNGAVGLIVGQFENLHH